MISISGAPPNSLAATPPPAYYDNYSGPANPACFLTMDAPQDWAGQSFTTTFKYNLQSVELWVKKGPGANVGNVDVELYAVDGSGHPTGPRLNTGVIPDADVSEDYSWVSCDLDDMDLTTYQLSAATKYCIVVHGASLSGPNPLIWGCGGDGSDYPNGDQEWSVTAGGSWATDTTRDQLFRCYTTPWLDNYSGTALPCGGSVDLNSADDWAGQTFIAMKSYTLNRIDIWMKKNIGDFVGNILYELYAVDGDGHPDMVIGALAEGWIPDADVPTEYAWVPCSLSEYNLVVDTKYCVVVHGFSLDAGNKIIWSGDYLYLGGDWEWSSDGGLSWITRTGLWDLLFRCYSA